MINMNYGIPVLLAASHGNENYCKILIREIKRFLPREFYTHIDKAVLGAVFQGDTIYGYHEYVNMGLKDYKVLDYRAQQVEVAKLDTKDMNTVQKLLAVSYPDAWLDEASMKYGKNYGIYMDGQLVSFAGLHAYSEKYQVAAVAHVTTHPDHRCRGYGQTVMRALLEDLMKSVSHIGLNVRADNLPALNCYRKLGFEEAGDFVDCEIKLN